MRTLTLALTTAGLALLVGCGGGSSIVTPTPDETSRENAVALAGDVVVAEINADNAFTPALASFELRRDGRMDDDSDGCRTREGDPTADGGMTITFDACETPRGTLSGTITFVFDRATHTRTETRDLTLTRLDGETLEIDGTSSWTHTVDHEAGTVTIHKVGESTVVGATRTIESESDLTWTRSRGEGGSPYPTGTSDTEIFENGELVKDVHLEFNGTSTVTATVDGETYTFELNRRGDRPRHHPRPNPGRGPRNR